MRNCAIDRATDRTGRLLRQNLVLILIVLTSFGCSHSDRSAKPATKPIAQPFSTSASSKPPVKPSATPPPQEKTRPPEEEPKKAESTTGSDESDKSDDPLADLDSEDSESFAPVGEQPRIKADQPPARGCVEIKDHPTRVWPSPGPSSIVAVDDDFVVSGYVRNKEDHRVFVVRLSLHSLPVPLVTERVQKPSPNRVAPPGLGIGSRRDLTLAITDGDGAVFIRTIPIANASAGGSLKLINKEGADIRFAPAISRVQSKTLVAWTMGTTPMEARLAVLDVVGKLDAVHAIKPPAMGAAGAVFIKGYSPPVLLVVDARHGYSPLIRIPVLSDGTPGRAKVAVPVGMVATPVELAAAHNQVGTYVGYTAVGQAATSAVGLIQIEPKTGSPVPLVPGTGYGPLSVAAVDAPKALIFAAYAPVEKGKADRREIHISLIDAQGTGPKTVVKCLDRADYRVEIARNQSGIVAVVYSSASGVYVSWLRCDDA